MKHEFFCKRRSVRSFSNQKLDTTHIEEMIEAAAHAPNTGNMQTVCAIITTDSELKAKLSPSHFNQPCVSQASALLTFCADFNRFNHWCRLSNAKPGFDNLQSLLAAVIDTSIFAQQFCTIAEMEGIGTVFLGTTLYNAAEIAEILNLPKGVVPVISLAIGYPAANYPAGPTDRLPVRAVMHHEQYTDFTDQEIHDLYSQLEAAPDSERFVKDNNKESLAQVFTDIRYPKATSDLFSETLSNFLTQQGFKL